MKEKLKGFFSVFIVLMLLPYVCTILFTGSMDREVKTNNSDDVTVMVQYNGNVYEMGLEEYLIGIVPMAMSIDYEKEALMAQAVIMRTNIIRQLAEANANGQEIVFDEEFVTYDEMSTAMPENELKSSYVKLEEAIKETKGIVAYYNNSLVELPYHSMSAGVTRVGEEVFNSSEYGYITGAESKKDMEGTNYLSIKTFTIEEIVRKCQVVYPDIIVNGVNDGEDESEKKTGNGESAAGDKNEVESQTWDAAESQEGNQSGDVITVEEVPMNETDPVAGVGEADVSEETAPNVEAAVTEETEETVVTGETAITEETAETEVNEETIVNAAWASQITIPMRDSAGYALQVQIGNTVIPAEKFRSLLNLNSSCMDFSIGEKGVSITTKGIGHGVGLSQYGANEMAKSGSTWEEILNYYFSDLIFLEQ